MGLNTEYGYIVIACFVFFVLIFMLKPLSNFAYTISQNWKPALFFAVCMIGGGLFAMNAGTTGYIPFNLSTSHAQPTEGQVDIAIADCKDFLIAESEGRDYQIVLQADSFYLPTTKKALWETCANVFGQNYWKNDISINSQDGGRMMCSLYRESGYAISVVETWCSTIFAGAGEAIQSNRPKAGDIIKMNN